MAKFTFADGTVFEGTVEELAEYARLASGEEAEQPAKPSVKVGDYIVSTGDYYDYTTEGKAYEVVGIDGDGGPIIEDDDGDEIGLDAHEYRIITEARELAFAKAGRKLDEFKAGDIVRFNTNTGGSGYTRGTIAEVEKVGKYGFFSFGGCYSSSPRWAELIAPAEARVDE